MTPARRLLATALCAVPLAIAAAGCGGGSSSNASSPLDEALGYLPKSAPFAVAIDTDLDGGQWKSLIANVRKLPFADQVEQQLDSSLKQQGVDFNKDVKPLLGNDLVIGSPTTQAFLADHTQVVGALQVKDKGKLGDLIKKSKAQQDGESNGAKLYKSDGSELAVKDDVVVFADSKQQVVAALQQRERDDRLTESAFNDGLSGLPTDALARLYLNAQSLLQSSPETAQARKVKWVDALQTFGLTASSKSDGIAFDFNLKTDASKLQDSDLPIASGDESPGVAVKPGEIGIGIRGIDQTVNFAESVAQIVSPSDYSDYLRGKTQIGKQLGIDVDKDLIGQLSGNATVAFDLGGHYAVRAQPKDPQAFSKTLAKFAKVAPAFAQGAGLKGAKITKVRGLYKLTGSDGETIYYGMVGDVFAASNDLARLSEIASQQPEQVPGAKGAVAIKTDAGKLIAGIVQQATGGGLGGALSGSLVTGPIGDLTGWADSSTSGISGHLQLEIK